MDESELKAIFNKLGTERVLDELDRKFGRKPLQSACPSSPRPENDPIAGDMWRDLEAKQAEAQRKAEEVKRYPGEYLRVPSGELISAISDKWEARGIFKKAFDTLPTSRKIDVSEQRADQKSPEARNIFEAAVKQVTKYLDRQPIWAANFSTTASGGAAHNQRLELSPEDSIYYITANGVSFRIRKASFYDSGSFRDVPQPLFEKIYFNGPKGELSETPRIGFKVVEVSTEKFYNLQGQNPPYLATDYISKLKIHRNGRKMVGILCTENVKADIHEGDRVNRIFFNKHERR